MVEAGIPAGVIEEVPMEPTEILHTAIEADRTVQFAQAQGYERLLVVAAPFHQERAFISVVTAVLRDYPSLKVYSHPGAPQPWDQVVTHSQGTLRGTRAELIAEELQADRRVHSPRRPSAPLGGVELSPHAGPRMRLY